MAGEQKIRITKNSGLQTGEDPNMCCGCIEIKLGVTIIGVLTVVYAA